MCFNILKSPKGIVHETNRDEQGRQQQHFQHISVRLFSSTRRRSALSDVTSKFLARQAMFILQFRRTVAAFVPVATLKRSVCLAKRHHYNS